MVHTFTGQQNAFKTPYKLAHFKAMTKIYLQVIGAASIFIAHEKTTLANAAAGGAQGGLSIDSTDKIKELWWYGDLWIVGSAANAQVNWEVMFYNNEA